MIARLAARRALLCALWTWAGCTPVGGAADGGDGGSLWTYDGQSRCVGFIDNTDHGALITFPTAEAPAQYIANCVAIRVGQTVTWHGDFKLHPLSGTAPVPAKSDGNDSGAIAFPDGGLFEFSCGKHPDVMWGEVKVLVY